MNPIEGSTAKGQREENENLRNLRNLRILQQAGWNDMMMKQGEWVKRGWLLGVFCGAVVWLALLAAPLPTAVAQDETTVPLTIRLRDSDGRPVTGEVVKLSRLPEETAVACTTDTQGECAWPAAPGLYQLLFDRPLDDITAAILGESGLRGLGVMVGGAPNGGAPNGEAPNDDASNGNKPLTYHFTFHSDGRVYFDLAPDAPLPVPKIPTAEESHFHEGGTAVPNAVPNATSIPVTTAVFVAAAPITTTQPMTGVVPTTAVPTATAVATTIAVSPIATPSPLDTQPARLSPVFILLLAVVGGAGFGYLTQRLYEWLTGRKDNPAAPSDTKDGR
ncbi:MAG: hypothetical protein IPH82_20655 [Chloroflexi bacterium]|nr:hypothetical protein [Chloroflexota bacterium]